MFTTPLQGATTHDLVFLVQDCGVDAPAAEQQLLAANATLIRSAASAFPLLPDADTVARDAFRQAIRGFTFLGRSLSTSCWWAMRTALEDAQREAQEPVRTPLRPELDRFRIIQMRPNDLDLIRRIARTDAAHASAGRCSLGYELYLGA